MDEFRDNGLWVANDDYGVQKIKLTQEQYDAAIRELNKKGNNGKRFALNELHIIVMKKFLYLFLICICLQSCMDFSQKIEKVMSGSNIQIDSTTYEIDLQDALGVKISEIFLFPELTSNEEITEIIGISLPHKSLTWSWNNKYHIICIYDKQVTYDDLFESKNVCFEGNDTIWRFSKEFQDLYIQVFPGLRAPTFAKYQVFSNPNLLVTKELYDETNNTYWYKLCQK